MIIIHEILFVSAEMLARTEVSLIPYELQVTEKIKINMRIRTRPKATGRKPFDNYLISSHKSYSYFLVVKYKKKIYLFNWNAVIKRIIHSIRVFI